MMEALLCDGEAALAELDALYAEDPLIEEIGLVFAVEDAPRRGCVLEEHRLGVPGQLLKPLHAFASQKLRDLQLQQVCSDAQAVLSATRGVLLVKGDVTHAWHLRKRLIQDRLLELPVELLFTRALLTRHPKAPPAWEHRRWCLRRAIAEQSETSLGCCPRTLEEERQLCAYLAELYPKNYYAWNHRLWLLTFMQVEQLEEELRWTHEWSKQHVSDHSAVSHIEQTVIALSAAQATCGDPDRAFRSTLTTILRQVDFANELVESRPGHETLWYHKRKLFVFTLQHLARQDSKIWCADNAILEDCIDELSADVHHSLGSRADHAHRSSREVVQVAQLLEQCQSDLTPQQLSTVLYSFLRAEVGIACRAIRKTDVWEYQKQRSAATRFVAFALHCALRYLATDSNDIGLAASNSHSLQLPNDNLQCKDLRCTHPVAPIIGQLAALVNERLRSEDELARCWLYLQSQYNEISQQRS